MTDRRILLADESETVRGMLAYFLSAAGYTVETAADGLEALRETLRTPPGLVLMNIRLPRMDGTQVCRMLKSDPATEGIPVVLLSSQEAGTDRMHAAHSGADRLVAKEFSPEELAEIVAEVFAGSPPRPAHPPAGAEGDAPPDDLDVVLRANRLLEARLFEATLFNEIGRVGQDVDDFEMMLRDMDRLLMDIVPHEAMAAVFTDTVALESVLVYPYASDDGIRAEVRAWVEQLREEYAVPCSPDRVILSEFPLNLRREEGAPEEPRTGTLRPEILVLIRSGEFVKGLAVLFSRKTGPGIAGKTLAEKLLRQGFLVMENAWLYRQITRMSTTDGLTGLTNVRAFREALKREHSRSMRHRLRYSILMMDIDHFKKINDIYGHPVGDTVLRELAAIIREAFRTTDLPARYGGEEFIVCLPETPKRDAAVVADRLRKTVERKVFASPSPALRATISMGITDFDPETALSEKEVIARADEALYTSKREGRNRITLR